MDNEIELKKVVAILHTQFGRFYVIENLGDTGILGTSTDAAGTTVNHEPIYRRPHEIGISCDYVVEKFIVPAHKWMITGVPSSAELMEVAKQFDG